MFTVELPVKPYVKQYIVLNYGNPADFSSNKYINERFRKCLAKPSMREAAHYKNISFSIHCRTVKIKITQDDFYRYGWELTITDIITFGKLIESQAKFLLHNMISFYMTFMNERDAILAFQNNFGFTEDIWPFDSIKKTYHRTTAKSEKISYTKDLSNKLENLILGNLSRLGTVSPKAVQHYENLKKTD
jgi:hypothetical protein